MRRRRSPSAFAMGTSGHCLIEALAARRIPYRYLPQREITNPRARRPAVAVSVGGESYYFDGRLFSTGGRPRLADGETVQGFIQDKMRVKGLLRANGFSVPEGAAFACEDREEAETFFIGFVSARPQGICLKPTRGWWGRHVYLGVRDLASFRAVWRRISERFDHVLMEEMALGEMHRVFCVGGRAIAAISWRTMNVVGDGRHTIEELIVRKNAERKLNPAYADFPLELGRQELRFLQRAGLDAAHVPGAGLIVYLRPGPNEDEATDITDTLHASYFALVERALALLPQIALCGADLIIKDASAPAAEDNYCLLEFNNPAGLVDHHHPWRGKSRDVAGAILDHLTSLTGRPDGETAR